MLTLNNKVRQKINSTNVFLMPQCFRPLEELVSLGGVVAASRAFVAMPGSSMSHIMPFFCQSQSPAITAVFCFLYGSPKVCLDLQKMFIANQFYWSNNYVNFWFPWMHLLTDGLQYGYNRHFLNLMWHIPKIRIKKYFLNLALYLKRYCGQYSL